MRWIRYLVHSFAAATQRLVSAGRAVCRHLDTLVCVPNLEGGNLLEAALSTKTPAAAPTCDRHR
jgi:hypothetical protein